MLWLDYIGKKALSSWCSGLAVRDAEDLKPRIGRGKAGPLEIAGAGAWVKAALSRQSFVGKSS